MARGDELRDTLRSIEEMRKTGATREEIRRQLLAEGYESRQADGLIDMAGAPGEPRHHEHVGGGGPGGGGGGIPRWAVTLVLILAFNALSWFLGWGFIVW